METESNGKLRSLPTKYAADWLDRLDYRTAIARAVRQRFEALTNDLGGVDSLSYQERSLCSRIVWVEALLETREAAIAAGEEINEGAYVQGVNALVGLLRAVGFERRTKPLPSLQDYLRQQGKEHEHR